MAINLSRYFTALGKIIASVNSVNTYQGTTLPARVAVLDAQYVSPNQSLITDLYPQEAANQDSDTQWLNYLQNLAVATAIQEVNLNKPMVNPSIQEALSQIAIGLRAAGQTVTSSPTVLANTPYLSVGDAQLVFTDSINQNDLYYADNYAVQVVSDQTTGSVAYGAQIGVTGTANVNSLSWLWPQGSNVQTTIQETDSANDTLIPSSFASWSNFGATSDTIVGPRGASGTYYKFTANAQYMQYELPVLAPGSYTWTLFVKGDASSAVASTVTVSIVNASGSLVASLGSFNAQTTTWTQASGVWNFAIQPPVSPSTYYLRVTGVSGGALLAHFALPGFNSALPLYPGGPVMYCWAGTTPLGLADSWVATVTRAASETVSLIRGMERLYSLSSYSPYIAIPTASPGTYQNTLVT